MSEVLNRIGKVALVLTAGLTVILAAQMMTAEARNRAMEQVVRTRLLTLASGEPIPASRQTARGRTVWELSESGSLIVRDTVRGYQSFLDVLIRLDRDLEYEGFSLLSASEGPQVLQQLHRGDLDALSGATVTVGAIRAAIARIRRDLILTREEES